MSSPPLASSSTALGAGRLRLPSAPTVAIVGAMGAVGAEMPCCLEQRGFAIAALRLYASARSAGRRIAFRDAAIVVETLDDAEIPAVDLALFSAGSAQSQRFAPAFAARGAVVIDNSSAFRMAKDVPLVIPEVNPEALCDHRGIVANPNCAALIALTALWPIHRRNRIERLVLATYQAASGAGAAAMEELCAATRAHLDGRSFRQKVLPHPYAFNVFSHDTRIDPVTGYNEEEAKIMSEARKIFGVPDLRVTATCVRVPVLRAHCVAINVECERPIDEDEVRAWLSAAPGVELVDDRNRNYFPMPSDASGRDAVLVGRIRRDSSDPSGRSIAMFVAGDQLRKGAALNAVQIAEALLPGA
jgi:aspartate-semialdehyde dehydrogenase